MFTLLQIKAKLKQFRARCKVIIHKRLTCKLPFVHSDVRKVLINFYYIYVMVISFCDFFFLLNYIFFFLNKCAVDIALKIGDVCVNWWFPWVWGDFLVWSVTFEIKQKVKNFRICFNIFFIAWTIQLIDPPKSKLFSLSFLHSLP